MNCDLIKVGARIQAARKKLGISQSSLAEHLNISVPHLSNIENSKKTVGLDIFIRIIKALGVSADVLLDINPEKAKSTIAKDILDFFQTTQNMKIAQNLTLYSREFWLIF